MNEDLCLDQETDRRFQLKWWRIERVAWIVMLLVVVAALLGLTGRGGPLSMADTKSGSVTFSYPQFSRWQTATALTAELSGADTSVGKMVLPQAFLEHFSVESISPRPTKVVALSDGQMFEFELDGKGAKTIQFSLRASEPAWWQTVSSDHPLAPSDMSFVILP